MSFEGNQFHEDIAKVFREENYEHCANLLEVIEAGAGSFEQKVFFSDLESSLMDAARSSGMSRMTVNDIVDNARKNMDLLYETFTRKIHDQF
ncbi:MAG TPA: hypothetical protein DHW71_11805 [Gammaproteobacteria bacterium]|nr:hypothetical protein [Gammaproteobacteria bacterium]MEC8009424.1 hypothetical protein [Pseudomonadota bacterium]HBF09807.1 hypothetical protein [Gammaproteobacteria bacterium]HCK93670.1 hypothetical protein [Gammaproteobacteria bacterium]|tara:strand:+ start:621 stop:896 length:276 start_codon:yes stop_codon:yes gene_type:complete